MFNKKSVLLLVVLLFTAALSQGQDFNWTKGFGGINTDYGHAVITDAAGNIYLTGEFYTSITIPPLPTVTSAGFVDFFIAKMDSLGNGIWIRKGGGTLTDRGFGVNFDNNGNIIATGVLYGICTFQGGSNPDVVLTSAGNLDSFIAKYDTAGNLLWIKQGSGTSQDSKKRAAIDNLNNIIVAGYFTAPTFTLDTVTLTGAGGRDPFIAKYDQNGNIQWGRSIGSINSLEEARGVVVDASNNIYTCGLFTGPVDLGGGITLTNTGTTTSDAFVIKYSPDGVAQWAKSFGGLKNDEAHSLLLDDLGNIYVGGNFDSAAVFGTTSLLSAGAYDAYLLKLDPSGNVLWVKTGGSIEAEYGYDVLRNNDKIYLAGSFRSTATFNTTPITTAGVEDMYLACYNSAGDILNIWRGGGATQDRGYGATLDAGGNIMVTGRFTGSATFGTTTITSAGTDDIFLTKIGNNAIPGPTFQLSVDIMDGWNMASVPGLHPLNQSVDTWWSNRNPLASVYKWTGSYAAVTNTTPTEGYWMLHSGALTYNTGGEWPAGGIQVVTHNPISISAGWNIIGGYEQSFPVAALTTTPPGLIVAGTIYGWNGAYYSPTNLVPGYAYWVYTNGAGVIDPPVGSAKKTIANKELTDNWGKIVITDASGKHFTLFSAEEMTDLDNYLMPPMPPSGCFDVRFSSGRRAEDLKSNKTIDLSGVKYPVTVTVEKINLKVLDESGKKLNATLKPGEKIQISSDINKLVVSDDVIPVEYSLDQNYPNPFNPSTLIHFAIPEDAQNITLRIFDATGQKVAELVNGSLKAGLYDYQWNAKNISSGVYIYQLRTEKFVSTKKMMLIK